MRNNQTNSSKSSDPTPSLLSLIRPGTRIPHTLRALRHRNFRLFWSGQLVSLIGTFMQRMGQGWLVYELSGSALALGIVGFAQFFPVLLFSPLGGVVTDRVPKQKLLLATQSGMLLLALALGVLTASGVVQVWHVIVLAVFFGILNAFDAPARQAFVVEMVGKDDLMNAIALNSSVFNGARLVGPMVAGLLVVPFGIASLFYINAVAFLAILINLLRMQLKPFIKPKLTSPWESLKEGIRYLRDHRVIRPLLGLVAMSSVFGISYITLLPAYTSEVLNMGASGFGFLLSAPSVGGLFAAYSLASAKSSHHKGLYVTVGNLVFAILLIVFSFSNWFWLSWLCLVGVGWGMLTQNATTNTLLQTLVPDELRGRVMSAYAWVLMGMIPIGSLIAGTLAGWWGTDKAILICALVLLGYAIWVILKHPQVRQQR